MKIVIQGISLKSTFNTWILDKLHNDLPFLLEIIKIENLEKLVCSLNKKKKYVVQIRTLKQALNHELVPKKKHRVIKFNLKAWLKQ